MTAKLVLPSLFAIFTLLTTPGLARAQEPPARSVKEMFGYFLGSWTGHETGRSGVGKGARTYKLILGEQYLFADNTSTFEPQPQNPQGEVHQDWALFSYDRVRFTSLTVSQRCYSEAMFGDVKIIKSICTICVVASVVVAVGPASSLGSARGENHVPEQPTPALTLMASEGRSAGPSPCRKKRKLYTVAPVAPSDLSHIIPLGNMAPPAHTFPTRHLYLHIRREVAGDYFTPSVEVPVAAPGRIWVTRIGSSENLTRDVIDYKINFSPCVEHSAYFIHLTTLAPSLLKKFVRPLDCHEYSTGGERYRLCERSVDVQLEAGDPVGTAGGGQDRNALDLGTSDLRAPELLYANADRWSYDTEQLHVVCPLDYFAPAVRRRLRVLLGDGATKRRKKPRCGQVAQDVAGTLQGIWFVPGFNGLAPEDRQLSMAHDNIVPTEGVFSVGTSMARSGLASDTYSFKPARTGAVNRDFDRVTKIGKVYCYEVLERFARPSDPVTIVLAKLTGTSTVQLERSDRLSCGSGPWQLGSSFTEFER